MRWLIDCLQAKSLLHGLGTDAAAWLAQEEQRQLDEVSARLDRVREQLAVIDRRRSIREAQR